MAEQEINVLPAEGLISVKALTKYLHSSDITIIEGLRENGIKFVKLSKLHDHWMIRLQDLKPKEDEIRKG